jgi:hypothetical protein
MDNNVNTNESDDWGWDDDDGGDVELAGGHTSPGSNPFSTRPSYQDQPGESYQDQPGEKTPPSQKKRLVRRTASKDRKDLIGGSKPIQHGMATKLPNNGMTLPQHQQQPPLAMSHPQVPRVNKLGSPKTKARKEKASPPPPKKEDDIFAEIGLSAKPTFSQIASRPAQYSLGATRLLPSADNDDDDLGGGDDWGDDADLDDLLND